MALEKQGYEDCGLIDSNAVLEARKIYEENNQLSLNLLKSIKGKKVVISGSGNVAQYAAEKVIQLGGSVISLSDSSGFIFDSEGINTEKLNQKTGYCTPVKSCFFLAYLKNKTEKIMAILNKEILPYELKKRR